MKTRNLILGMAAIGATFTSCKNEEQQKADKTVDMQTTYVDSVASISADEAQANWAAIDAAYQQHTMDAEAAVANAADKAKAQEKVDKSKAKYEEVKAKVQAAMPPPAPTVSDATGPARIQALRDSFFGAGKIGSDVSFAWVNKDNIVSVYENFYNTFDKNQDSYSREDLDEIKTLYEALDTRKNTVEKEGLSGPDNRKIAALKLKFAPKFKWDRVTSKGEENKEAKKEAK
ncbi:hypothetical protein [Flavobacterium silvaticum]|uniref:Lipoprotein n=1 Tax=Flavobacterium silvaticum TaxID=1852020 RepID=A0A972JGQ6_9FLAO|nr:hypothetical protein [Flavobacterium silvaticum]NMH29294.1 hypothetical protein [Flavobacterium silvaticum]